MRWVYDVSGAGFQSKSKYMFGKVTIQIKLVEGDSAGTVTAFYVSILKIIHLCIKSCLLLFHFYLLEICAIDCCLAGLPHDHDLCLSPFNNVFHPMQLKKMCLVADNLILAFTISSYEG